MGWQKDEIEELAAELDIDGGDSISQQDRLRKIAEEVGMEDFNGLSNTDTDELERRLKEKQEDEDENATRASARAINNNNRTYNKANINKRSLDNIKGNQSSLATKTNRNHKNANFGRGMQGSNSRYGRSGITSSLGKNQNKSSFINNSDGKGEFELKMPLKVKIIFYAAIIGASLLFLMLFMVLFNDEIELSSTISGTNAYGQTCPIITIIDSDCDENNINCTNKYNGEVDYETYIAGVVAAEFGDSNNSEIYKLAAVLIRTYTQKNIGSDCNASGNSSFQKYMNIEESPYAEAIKNAVAETEGELILQNDRPIDAYYSEACVVGVDANYYYIRYGSVPFHSGKIQAISKTWDANNNKNRLQTLYNLSNNTSDTDHVNNPCTDNNTDKGLSKIGAINLIKANNYTYQAVLEHYYSKNINITENSIVLTGTNGFVNPVRTINCSSPFGDRDDPTTENEDEEFHNGLDIAITEGEPIFAAKAGTVTYVEKNVKAINNCKYGYGNYIKIKHDDGTETVYGHMKYRSIQSKIVSGYKVAQGEQIGQVGSTGCSTGSHLHYEIIKNGSNIDPIDYMDLTNSQGVCKR